MVYEFEIYEAIDLNILVIYINLPTIIIIICQNIPSIINTRSNIITYFIFV